MLKIFALASAISSFSAYPGFQDSTALVEMTTDKGLIVEIVLRCGITPEGTISSGIMSYSKVERLFCSSKSQCFGDVKLAIADTCNWQK